MVSAALYNWVLEFLCGTELGLECVLPNATI